MHNRSYSCPSWFAQCPVKSKPLPELCFDFFLNKWHKKTQNTLCTVCDKSPKCIQKRSLEKQLIPQFLFTNIWLIPI